MEIKKYPNVDVRKRSDIFFMTGLVVALGVTFAAFSYHTTDEEKVVNLNVPVNEEVEEIVDPTVQNQPPPPPPPPPTTIEVVEDDADVEEADIESSETDQTEEIKPLQVEQVDVGEQTQEPEIFEVVEDPAEYPGGEAEMMKFIVKNLEYPPLAKENNIQGRVVVEFIVRPDGSITDIKVLKDLGYGTGQAAIDVVKKMPKWKPGKQRNKAVSQRYRLPLRFQLG